MNRLNTILVTLLLTASLNAATIGTLTLSGVVATVYSITVLPQSAATSLNITGGESNATVATVEETSNNSGGYKISLSSANGGKLTNGASELVYTLSYDGGTASQPTASPTVRKTSGTLGGLTTDTSSVTISFSALPNAVGGTYSDVVTFEIAAP